MKRLLVAVFVSSLLSLAFLPTVSAALPTIVEDTAGYGGFIDYDAQVFRNLEGDLIAIYGRGEGENNERLMARYSLDGGNAWSNRFVLFSTSAQGDGIIDNDVSSMWEVTGRTYNNILYLSFHLQYPAPAPTVRIAFTKCDINQVSDIAVYSNWKSASGNSANSSGEGSNHWGYDIISARDSHDPTIAVLSSEEIVVLYSCTNVGTPTYLNVSYWNGNTWDIDNVIWDNSRTVTVSVATVDSDDNIHVAFQYGDGSTGETDILYKRLASGDNPTVATNWRNLSGDAPSGTYDSFDRAIENATAIWGFPKITCLPDNSVVVMAGSFSLVNSFHRTFFNWHDGSTWQKATNEDDAGREVDTGNLDLELPSYNRGGIANDGAGNAYYFYQERTTNEIRYIKFDKTAHTWGSYSTLIVLTDYAAVVANKFNLGNSDKVGILFSNYTVTTSVDLYYHEITGEAHTFYRWWDTNNIFGRSSGTQIGIGATFEYIVLDDNTVEFRPEAIGRFDNSTITYYWQFSDGETSNEMNPIKTFSYTGITADFKASLTVCNEDYCSHTVERDIHLIRWWMIILILVAIIVPITLVMWKKM